MNIAFSDNKYLTSSDFTQKGVLNYSFVAPERIVNKSDALLAVGCVVALLGFNIRLTGTQLLTDFLMQYVFDKRFCYEDAVERIANASGADDAYIEGCVKACIENNEKFNRIASELLETHVTDDPDLSDVLEIMGAVFKIYYNYTLYNDNVLNDITDGSYNE